MSDASNALAAEVKRLTECLKQANSQAEHFERKWYLEVDAAERLRAAASDLMQAEFVRPSCQAGVISKCQCWDCAKERALPLLSEA